MRLIPWGELKERVERNDAEMKQARLGQERELGKMRSFANAAQSMSNLFGEGKPDRWKKAFLGQAPLRAGHPSSSRLEKDAPKMLKTKIQITMAEIFGFAMAKLGSQGQLRVMLAASWQAPQNQVLRR